MMFVMSLLLRDQTLGNTVIHCDCVPFDAVMMGKVALRDSCSF